MPVKLDDSINTQAAILPTAKRVSQQAVRAQQADEKDGILKLWQLRDLIMMMAKRDLVGRYKGSVMGAFWTLINPIGHLILYTFLFSVVLKVRLGTDASTSNYALYLMAGILPWTALSESIIRSTSTVLENPNLVKRVVFPLEVLPLVVVISSLSSELVALVPLAIAASIYLGTLHWTLIFLPLVLLSQTILVAGICWLLSSLGVFIQDIRHAISLALSVWMYATPIVYPASRLPEKLHFLLWINPMAGIVGDYRRILLEGVPPDWTNYAVYTTLACVLFVLGLRFFCSTKRSFADVM